MGRKGLLPLVGFLFFFVSTFSIFTACKNKAPLIPYDRPFPTATPVSGSIMAAVIDNNLPTGGVTVQATDPYSNLYVTTTDFFGLAAFNPDPLKTGVWTITVPTQGKYYLSTSPLTITASSKNAVTFIAGNQSIWATPISSPTYNSGSTSIVYNVVYKQPNNLRVPVTLCTSGIPNTWTESFTPVTIGGAVDNCSVTLTKVGCLYNTLSFFFNANGLLGSPTLTRAVNISRGYSIPVTIVYHCTGSNLGGTNDFYYGTFTFYTKYDCGVSWDFNWTSNLDQYEYDSNYNIPIYTYPDTADFSASNGSSVSITFTNAIGNVNNAVCQIDMYSAIGDITTDFNLNVTSTTPVTIFNQNF